MAAVRSQLRVDAAGLAVDWTTFEVAGPRVVGSSHGRSWFEWVGTARTKGAGSG